MKNTVSLKPTVFFVTAENEQFKLAGQNILDREFHVEEFGLGAWLNSQLQKLNPDLVIFEMCSQILKGIASCKKIRSLYQGPLMIVSDHGDEAIQVLGLEAGADDFLIGPVSPALFQAKVRTLMRRGRLENQFPVRIKLTEKVSIDLLQREVQCEGKSLGLTTREFDLFLILAQKAGKVLTRDDLYEALFNNKYNGCDRSVDIYISRLRQKLGKKNISPRLLRTVRGYGYMMINNA